MPQAKYVRELIGRPPITLDESSTVAQAASRMRDENVGAIVVLDPLRRPRGIVTDRDITVRAVANGLDPATTSLRDVCTTALATLSPDDTVELAVIKMRDNAVRRLLIIDAGNQAVGVISLGDLAVERDAWSALGKISAAPPNG
jgi:CBS domain-containing protein